MCVVIRLAPRVSSPSTYASEGEIIGYIFLVHTQVLTRLIDTHSDMNWHVQIVFKYEQKHPIAHSIFVFWFLMQAPPASPVKMSLMPKSSTDGKPIHWIFLDLIQWCSAQVVHHKCLCSTWCSIPSDTSVMVLLPPTSSFAWSFWGLWFNSCLGLYSISPGCPAHLHITCRFMNASACLEYL